MCTLVVSFAFASRKVSGGRTDGFRLAIIDFPEPGGPMQNVVPAGGGDFDRAFDMLLTFSLVKIKDLISKFRLGPIVGGTHRFQGDFASQKLDDFG